MKFNLYPTTATASTSDTTLIYQGGAVKQLSLPYSWSGGKMTVSALEASGTTTIAAGSNPNPGLQWDASTGFYSSGSGTAYYKGTAFGILGALRIGSDDTILLRDGASNTLAMRNGTNAQQFRLYNTYTDSSNSERALVGWSGNEFWIGTEKAGTGVNRTLALNGNVVSLRTDGVSKWQVTNIGNFVATTDNSYDIGANGANRPRSIYTAGSLFVGGANPAQLLLDGTNRLILRPNTGTGVRISAGSGSDANDHLIFGVTAATHPMLRRSGTTLQVRLADNSDDAPLSTGDLTIGGGTPIKSVLSAVASLSIDSGGNPGATATVTVTGANVGDAVFVSTTPDATSVGWHWSAYVSSSNTVTIQLNITDGTTYNRYEQFRVVVLKF